jgi:predicted MFS family arabinose efflux permease
VGTYLFSKNPEIGSMNIPKSKRRLGGILKKPIVFATVLINLCLVATFGGAEVGTVAVLGVAPSGIVIAALSLGSIIGGFAFGHRAKTKWALLKFLSVVAVGYLAVFFNPTDLVWITICWFITGIGVAPAFATMASMISVSLGTSDSAEAFGWNNTGQLLGFSFGAAIAGILIDNVSPQAAWYVTGISAALALFFALITVRFNPSLEHKDA